MIWRFFEVEGQSMVDEAPAVPLVVGGGFALHEWYCRQHGWINVRRAFRAGRGGLVANFETGPPPWQDRPAAAAAAVGAPPVAPLVRIGAAAAAAAAAFPFTFHGGLDPFTAGRTSRVYPRTEPRYQRFLRTTMRRYPPQGVAACSGGRHGPCNEG